MCLVALLHADTWHTVSQPVLRMRCKSASLCLIYWRGINSLQHLLVLTSIACVPPCSCVSMLADLFHAENSCGTATVGSSEVGLGLARLFCSVHLWAVAVCSTMLYR